MDLKPVYFAHNSTAATVVQHALQDAGIDSRILGGELQGGALDIVESNPVVVVAAENFDEARQVIEQFRLELQSGHDLAEMSDAEGQFNWPLCPQCDELREATCTICQTTSNEFSAEVNGDELVVFCLACSQQVEVSFADRCRYCMHDFTAADSAADNESGSAKTLPAANHGRAIMVVGGLGLLFVILAIWFATSMS